MNAARWRPAFIGAGSNLDDPLKQLDRGIAALAETPGIMLARQSCRYRSAPLGPQDQPDFVNAVLAVMTTLDARALLQILQRIEDGQGRDRTEERWGPRTLDLDILAFSQDSIDEPDLKVPHPGIVTRIFVLWPWREIAPHFHVPGLGTVAVLADRLTGSSASIEKIA